MNKSNAGPMRPATKMRLVGRAARYLEQEAKEYKLAARDDSENAEFFGHRAAQLIAAARTLRNLEFK